MPSSKSSRSSVRSNNLISSSSQSSLSRSSSSRPKWTPRRTKPVPRAVPVERKDSSNCRSCLQSEPHPNKTLGRKQPRVPDVQCPYCHQAFNSDHDYVHHWAKVHMHHRACCARLALPVLNLISFD